MAAEAHPLLVTGANGHLGRRLAERVAAIPPPRPKIRAVVRSQRAADTLRALPEDERPEFQILDYGDRDALARAAAGCTGAVHLVGIIKETSQSRYVDAHEIATQALADAADAAGLRRVVYLSILGAHPDSANACLASKGRAERILLDAKTPALVLRVPMVLGPDDFASRALRGRAMSSVAALTRGGATLEQPIDADDVVSAILAGLERDGLDDTALDLAGPESLPHRELVARAAKLYGRSPRILPVPLAAMRALAAVLGRLSANPPMTGPMLEILEHDDVVDPSEACRRLGITLTPLDETLRRCVGPEAP